MMPAAAESARLRGGWVRDQPPPRGKPRLHEAGGAGESASALAAQIWNQVWAFPPPFFLPRLPHEAPVFHPGFILFDLSRGGPRSGPTAPLPALQSLPAPPLASLLDPGFVLRLPARSRCSHPAGCC